MNREESRSYREVRAALARIQVAVLDASSGLQQALRRAELQAAARYADDLESLGASALIHTRRLISLVEGERVV